MKLPSELNASTKPSTPTSTSQTRATRAPNPDALPRTIQALINTWAKVESSQTLSASQNQQVLSQLAQLKGQPLTVSQNPSGQGVSEKLNLGNIAQSMTSQQPLSNTLKLALIKLMSVTGPISILSARPLKADTQVLLTQNTQGTLTLQTAQNPVLLNQFRTQFIGQNFIPTPIPLIDNHQASDKQTHPASYLAPLPSSTLKSGQPLTNTILQQAISNSGQNLESKLAQILTAQPIKNSTQATATLTAEGLKPSSIDQSMSNKIAQVEQNIQKWVAHFQQKLISPTNTTPSTATSSVTVSAQSGLPINQSLPAQQSVPPSLSEPVKPTTTMTNGVSSDHKNWLIQSQQSLMEQLNARLLQRKDSFIPHWPAMTTQGQANTASIKTFQDLSQWLTLLMMPKHSDSSQGESLWPKSLAAQPQLQQTLSALLNSFTQSESDANEASLLRQLLNINQTLSKLTHDQIQNRLWQGQSDTTQFQLSLPFVQQNQVQWCEFECKQQQTEQHKDEKTTGWHLILRFAQNTEHAFAIESHLKQEQLALTLWANQAQQLKRLHQNMPLIKQKLEHAGFKVDHISSKHGSPKPLNMPIQQSLIDVHT
jgi:hypothetical protein